MSTEHSPLRRLRPFEGLCLTAQDFADEQGYHRKNLARHNSYLHGHGIVQGLKVELTMVQAKHHGSRLLRQNNSWQWLLNGRRGRWLARRRSVGGCD